MSASTSKLPQTSNFYPRPPRGGRRGFFWGIIVGKSISIHALREEGDDTVKKTSLTTLLFLSTPSARRATDHQPLRRSKARYFYPRPPRGGRPRRYEGRKDRAIFLSTPSARRATYPSTSTALCEEFLSTPSARRATIRLTVFSTDFTISIHALREEGDYGTK